MLKINDRKWKEIHLSEIVKSIERGKVSDLRNIDNGENIIIAAAGVNDDFSCFSNIENISSMSMTISLNGVGTGTAFVHNYPYNLNSDCGLVITKKEFSIYVLHFIAIAINKNKNKFNYGYKANEHRLLRQTIMLPIDKKGNPDYDFMEQFIKEREELKKKEYIEYAKKKVRKLKSTIRKSGGGYKREIYLKPFYINEIFNEIERGKRLIKEKQINGKVPYVSSSSMNNGVDAFIGNNDKVRKFSNCLSLANSGSVGSCFYEPFNFIASDHVTHLKNDDYNEYIYLFLSTIINRLAEKYNFNREINDERIEREKIMLPIEKNSKINYEYMSFVIQNIELKRYDNYISYVK